MNFGLAGMERWNDLVSRLCEAGVPVRGADPSCPPGFPASIKLATGQTLTIEFPEPALLSAMNPEALGVAVIDGEGFCRASWGLASTLDLFDPLRNVLMSEIGALLEAAFRGVGGSLLYSGLRFFASGTRRSTGAEAVVLVVNALEEEQARKMSVRANREAEALKRFGRVLSMNQTLQPLCVSAVHELASSARLSAALLWVLDSAHRALTLTACTGANRVGTSALGALALQGTPTCLAEMVAVSAQPLFLEDVQDHVMTRELEARFCYLPPGGVSIHPLYIGGNVIGVLELLGREGDDEFAELHHLFQTLSEHLALAVNSAMLFENVEKMANDDALTGIANHRTLQQFLHNRLAEARRTGGEIGLMMIDVDHFRNFNEEEGHDVGDEVLRHVSQILKESVRPYDLAARYGGEEFTIVLPGSGLDTTRATAERIRRHVEAMPIVTRSGHTRHITVSIGCAVFPSQANDSPTLIQAADSALFRAKREGRNRVVIYAGASLEEDEKVSLEEIFDWVPKRLRAKVEKDLEFLTPALDSASVALGLNERQATILRALALLNFSLGTKGRAAKLAALSEKEAAGIRALLPSLSAMEERFDGKGPGGVEGNRIPLMSRVLVAVQAYAEGGEEAFAADPGRFDPEIVQLVLQRRQAA